MRVRKAIIPVAGLGTRLLPFTKAVPKELIPILDTPVIQYIVEEAIQSGIKDIIFVSSAKKQAVHNYFDYQSYLEEKKQMNVQVQQLLDQISADVNFISVWQREPKGLGDAILCAQSLIGDEPFAVFLPDDLIVSTKPCMQQLLDVFQECQSSVLGLMPVAPDQASSYGIVKTHLHTDKKHSIIALQEKPSAHQAYSNLAIVGRYVLTAPLFSCLRKLRPGAQGEVQLTDALSMLLEKEPIWGFLFEGTRFDTGDSLGWLQANVTIASQRSDMQSVFLPWLTQFLRSFAKD